MKAETFEMQPYDFVLEITRMFAGQEARRIALVLQRDAADGDKIVLTGPVPKWLSAKIETRRKPRRQRVAEPMLEYQCSGDTTLGVRLLWETGRSGRERQYLIDLRQLGALCLCVGAA